MARSGASAASSSGTAKGSARGVPIAPRGKNRPFKRPAPKTMRPEEPDDTLERLRAIERKKATVKAEMTLQGKPKADIDQAMRKIDEELKLKQKPKPNEQPEAADQGGADDAPPEQQREQQQDNILPAAIIMMPRKKGLPTIFGNISERGLRVAPLAPDSAQSRKQRAFKQKPSILAMQNARMNLKAANTSKGPGTGARGGFSASGGPSGAGGGPR